MGPAQKESASTILLGNNLASRNSKYSHFYLPAYVQSVHRAFTTMQSDFWVPKSNRSLDFPSQHQWQEAD